MAAQQSGDVVEAVSLRAAVLQVRPEERVSLPGFAGRDVRAGLEAALARCGGDIEVEALDGVRTGDLGGRFADGAGAGRRIARPDRTYALPVGTAGPEGSAAVGALVDALAQDGRLAVGGKPFRVTGVECERASHESLVTDAGSLDRPTVTVRFATPTRLEAAGAPTTMPHRWAVFGSLLTAWNRTAPPTYRLGLERERLLAGTTGHLVSGSYETHAVPAGAAGDGRVEAFTGECRYVVTDDSPAVSTVVGALGGFADYAGVGVGAERGLGTVDTTVA